MNYGLQLYSIRDITGNDLGGALEKVAALGYKNVEFAGFFGHSADEVLSMLNKHGLKVSGTHTQWVELRDSFDATVQYHKAIGNSHIIIPGADLSTAEKLDEFITFVNKAQVMLEKEDITLGYHNHSHEFIPNDSGQIIYDELLNRTSLRLEIDTYWAYAAGKNPVQMMQELKERLDVIHIKDGDCEGNGTPLGMGTAPVDAVYNEAIKLGVPMVVESETLNPDGLTEAKICIEYLKKLEAR